MSSPPPASKAKEVSDGENLEVSTKPLKLTVGETLPNKHLTLVFKALILINRLNIIALLNNLFYVVHL